jgi:hypothetical protein
MLLAVAQSGDPVLQAYRDNILLRQTVTRYANAWHHVKPFWYYLTSVIPPFWLPLSCCCPGWWWPGARPSRAGQAHHIAARLPGAGDPLLLGLAGQARRLCHAGDAGSGPADGSLRRRAAGEGWPARLLGGLGWLLGIVCVGAAGALAFSARLASRLGSGPGPLAAPAGDGGALLLVNALLRRAPLSAILCSLAVGWLIYSSWICVRLNDMRTPEG